MADISDATPLPPPDSTPTPAPEPAAPPPVPEAPSAPLPAPETPSAARLRHPMTRREVLVALAAGGAVVATNTGTALITDRIATGAANRHAQVRIGELEGQVSRLERQLALYGDMERLGLDKLIRSLLELYDRFWPPVRSAVGALLGAVRAVEDGVTHFELKLPSVRSASSVISGLLTGIDAEIQSAQDMLNDLLKRSGPIGEAVSGFLTWLVNRNPLGITTTVRDAIDRLSALVAGFPPLVSDVRRRLLGPLDEEWLATAAGQGLQGLLFDPLRTTLLTPLRAHLEEMDEAAAGWEEQVAPIRTALNERDKIRGEIASIGREAQQAALLGDSRS